MLFFYKYANHDLEKMQKLLDFLFKKVWCIPKGPKNFHLSLLSDCPELMEVYRELKTSGVEGGAFFVRGIERIYEGFRLLNSDQFSQILGVYEANNSIEQACTKKCKTMRYEDLRLLGENLLADLRDFYMNLYSQSFLGLVAVRRIVGSIDNHFEQFSIRNSKGKCPYCGLHDMKGQFHSKREAYDHYLPKSKYPFNTINLRNLSPACSECNETYKLARDPLRNEAGDVRRAFYPYSQGKAVTEISIKLDSPDLSSLLPEHIEITFGPAKVAEETTTWRDLFGIDERYKGLLCSEEAYYWFEQVAIECQNVEMTPEKYLGVLRAQHSKNRYFSYNFLRLPFLMACMSNGLIPDSKRTWRDTFSIFSKWLLSKITGIWHIFARVKPT